MWQRIKRLLDNDRVHWLGATLVAAALAVTWRSYFGDLAAWSVVGAVLLVFLMSEVPKISLVARVGKRQEMRSRRSRLTRRIDRYAKQVAARRQQRPWLVVSLISAALAYLLMLRNVALWALSEQNVQAPDYACMFLAGLISLATMMIAGAVAEDDPPSKGKERVLRFLARYTPQDPAKRRDLLRTIEQGTWVLTDLIAFAASEDEQRRLEETKALEKRAFTDSAA
jgi:hypothetical protein